MIVRTTVLVVVCALGLVVEARGQTDVGPVLLVSPQARGRLRAIAKGDPQARETLTAARVAATKADGTRPERLRKLVAGYVASGDRKLAAELGRLLVGWARGPSQGDPADDPHLPSLVAAHGTVRAALTARQRRVIEARLRRVGQRTMTSGAATVDPALPKDATDARRIRLVGSLGLALENQSMMDWTLSAYGLFMAGALRADGSTDAGGLTSLLDVSEPLVALAVDAAGRGIGIAGTDLFRYQGEQGGSLRKMIEVLVRSRDVPASERARAAAVITCSTYFEPGWRDDAARLRAGDDREAAWLELVIAALRPSEPARPTRRPARHRRKPR